jgi:trimeric autotransporter adhesin
MSRLLRRLAAPLAAIALGSLAVGTAAAAPDTPAFGRSIEALASYDSQTTCSPTVKTGTGNLRTMLLNAYPGTGDLGIVRACTSGGISEHKEGRAWDWKVNAFDARQDAQAKDFFAWALASDQYGNRHAIARRLGIMYMIYNRQIWSASNPDAGWRPYTGASPHTDHVHISLTRRGGDAQVTYWTSGITAGATKAISDRWYALGGPRNHLGRAVGDEYPVPGGRAQTYERGRIIWSPGTGARGVWGLIHDKYMALGGPSGPLGLPTSDETATAGGGRVSIFQGGRVYWSPETGAHAVWGSVGAKHLALGGAGGQLGLPLRDEADTGTGGRVSVFQGGRVYWSPATGAHAVWGLVGDKYLALGGPQFLGLPVSDEAATPAATPGRVSRFERGAVYFSPATGANGVWGAVGAKYEEIGGPSALGLPVSDEAPAGPSGRMSTFEDGRIYYTTPTGAQAVSSTIANRYEALGGPASRLGFPTADESALDTGGRMATFQGGRIYWSSATGSRPLYNGPIATRYDALGGPRLLGVPTGDEVAVGSGRVTPFEKGRVYWSSATGASGVWGAIGARYDSLGGPTGRLGFPTVDETRVAGGVVAAFQNGRIYHSPTTGAQPLHAGPMAAKYDALGGPGFLGLPTAEDTAVGTGRVAAFQRGKVYTSPAGTWGVWGLVGARYEQLGGPTGRLGFPTSDEKAVPGGVMSAFQNGRIYHSPTTGAQPLHAGPLAAKYDALGGPGFLGLPTAEDTAVGTGRVAAFQRGKVYTSPAGTWGVWGLVGARYEQLGGPTGRLGFPTSDEVDAGSGGRVSRFQNGRIYFTSATGAQPLVTGAVASKYDALGGPGFLGFPLGEETAAAGTNGRVTRFQRGKVYTSPAGTFATWGLVGAHYDALGGPAFLGLPTADEASAPGGGRVGRFQGGSVYFSSATGARGVWGIVGAKYEALGGPASPLGYPTSDEVGTSTGARVNVFRGGRIYWSPGTGARSVWGSINDRYQQLGGDAGRLGLPVSDEYAVPGGARSDFQHGRLTFEAATGLVRES